MSDTTQREIRHLRPHDREWPTGLRSRPAGSALAAGLWVRGAGDLSTLLRQAVVIVGRSEASPYAVDAAYGLACGLSEAGWTVVTSGNLGVASAAQRGALSVGRATAALPLGGLARPLPIGHAGLFKRIARHGLLVGGSRERPSCAAADRTTQSALLACIGAAVVLIEPQSAGVDGRVVRLARESARPLLAVPGPASVSESAFAHQLLRDGAARLVRDARDVLADLDGAP